MGGAARLVAGALAWLVGDVLRVRRAHVEASMERAGVPEPDSTARSMYRSLARAVVELLTLAFGAKPSFEPPGDLLASIRGGGRGAVVATAHTGSWDVVACRMAELAPLTVVTKRLSIRPLDSLWQRLRRDRGVRLVAAGRAARAVGAALGRGELVAMVVDQAPERERAAIRVPFLGAPAWVDLAPALCALRGKCPLVAAFPLRLASGEHRVVVARVLWPPPLADRAWPAFAMGEVTRALEEFVRAHPEQWLWMHRRWKDVPRRSGASPGPRALADASAPG
jgi:KDO2-lipid IV(A) lauroyltransferase